MDRLTAKKPMASLAVFRRVASLVLSTLLCALAAASPAWAQPQPSPAEVRELKNLHAFTQLYGYVRYFYPGDEAAALDWDGFAIYGAERVQKAPDQAGLKAALEELFRPIAPALELAVGQVGQAGQAGLATPLPAPPPEGPALRRLAWQHQGVGSATPHPIFRSARVSPDRDALFAAFPAPVQQVEKQLADGLFCRFPLSLWADGEGTLPRSNTLELAALKGKLAAIGGFDASQYAHRLAPAIVLWNLAQHFDPYFAELGLAWQRHLIGSFRGMKTARSLAEVDEVLHVHLLVLLADAQARLRHPDLGGEHDAFLPLALFWVNGELVVGASQADGILPGDVLLAVDGRRFTEVLDVERRRLSGSPQFRQAAALESFGRGREGSEAEVLLQRRGEELRVRAQRSAKSRPLPFLRAGESIAEQEGGVLYADLRRLSGEQLEEALPRLAGAKAVIFDARGEVGAPAAVLFSHLSTQPLTAPPERVAQRILPDQDEPASWLDVQEPPAAPKPPRLAGKLVFLADEFTRGPIEELLQAVQQQGLGKVVGSCSAGSGGLTQELALPGGFTFTLTLGHVSGFGGQAFFLQGVCADEEVGPSREGLRAGRDEVLEQALARLRS